MTDEELKKYLPGKRKFMVQVMLEESSGGLEIDHAAKVKDILQQTFGIGLYRISGPMLFQELEPIKSEAWPKKVNTVNLEEPKSSETGE